MEKADVFTVVHAQTKEPWMACVRACVHGQAGALKLPVLEYISKTDQTSFKSERWTEEDKKKEKHFG